MKQVSGRPEIAPFPSPVIWIEDFNLVGTVFPVDGMLPTLIPCTDVDHMVKVFSATFPDVLSGSLTIDDLRIEPVAFGRFSRAVLRYYIDGHQPDKNLPTSQLIYGKVDSGGTGGLTVPIIAALRENLRDPRQPLLFPHPTLPWLLP